MKRIALASVLLLSVCAWNFTACSANVEESSSVNANGEVLAESRDSETEEVTSSGDWSFEGEPGMWRHETDGFTMAIPACFETDLFGPTSMRYTYYQSYRVDDDTKYWMYTYFTSWADEAPSWMETDNYSQSLDDIPGYMVPFVIDTFSIPGIIDGHSPFSDISTEFTIDDEQYVEIDGEQYIRHEGSATANAYGLENTIYFTIYYGVYEFSYDDKPFFCIVMTTDGSDEAREYINETCDYAMTYFYT